MTEKKAKAKAKRRSPTGMTKRKAEATAELAFAEVLDELDRVDGLGEEFEDVAAVAGASEDFDGGCLPAEENDASVGAVHADGNAGFDAVDLRHEDIGEDDIGAVSPRFFNRLCAAIRRFGDEAIKIEDLNDGICDYFFVIYDKNSKGRALNFGVGAGGGRGVRACIRGAAAEKK
jgi:hypothetical protein